MKKITRSSLILASIFMAAALLSCGIFGRTEGGYMQNYSKAHQFMLANQPYDAIPFYRKVLAEKKDFAAAYQEIAVCYQQMGEVDSAIVYYMGAIVYNPKNVDAYQAIGNIYYTEGNDDEAMTWYDRATEVDYLYPRSYNNMATIWLSRGNLKLARKYYDMAITVDATYPRAYYGLGIVALQENNREEAESRFLDAVNVGSMPEAIYMLGQLYFEAGEYNKATVWLNRYLENQSFGEWADKAREMLATIKKEEK
jgi:tetratricopeptide (TPR) repeat protein